jgi:tRNA threonylcarbamoyladenosine biosynthesis protein TsaB
MNLLALDTSSPVTSVCILTDGSVRVETSVRAAVPQAADHLRVVDGALKQAGLALAELDAFAGTVGPGSFTGLRVGLSFLKGFAAEKPLFAVSTLAALAHGAGAEVVVPCIDAKRGEVYAAVYAGGTPLVFEGAYAPGRFAELAAQALAGPSRWVGDGARLYREVYAAPGRSFAPPLFDIVRAAAVADLAWARWQAGERPHDDRLVPNYLRASEAERNAGSTKRV